MTALTLLWNILQIALRKVESYIMSNNNNKKQFIKISTAAQLIREIKNGYHDFFIFLNGGLKSSKYITYDKEEDVFYITNLIDGTEQELNTNELFMPKHTNIGEAILKGAFYVEK